MLAKTKYILPESAIQQRTISHKKEKTGHYPPIIPDINDWRVNKMTEEKEALINTIIEEVIVALWKHVDGDSKKISDLIAKALYLEKARIKTEPWKVDPADDKAFWNKVNNTLVETSLQQHINGELPEEEQKILYEIISRYTHEIMGNFNPKTYKFVSKVLPFSFSRMLNTSAHRLFFTPTTQLQERIRIHGPIEHIRELALQGTLILTPTHFSNLDSVLIGWTIHRLGLPAFLYGAGLNLFNSGVFKYFMSRLGAYKLDRRKKNRLYIQTLLTFSEITIRAGFHTLFFPGGTRSRNGALEKRLKLGLLGSVLDAQRNNYAQPESLRQLPIPKPKSEKLFIIPLVLNYHVTLEAGSLIDQYLKRSGKSKYFIERIQSPDALEISKFIFKFLRSKSEVHLTFGEPMDIFGNMVDFKGNSYDKQGEKIDISGYFKTAGSYKADKQRDAEYTKMLATAITDSFYRNSMVLSSQLIAFVAFELLKRRHRRLDEFGILRLTKEDTNIPYAQFAKTVEKVRDAIMQIAEAGQIKYSRIIPSNVDKLIDHGLRNLGVFHLKRALVKDKNGDLYSQDLNLLYYYHNRLSGYELEKLI